MVDIVPTVQRRNNMWFSFTLEFIPSVDNDIADSLLLFAYGNYTQSEPAKEKAYNWLCAIAPEKNSIITCFTQAHVQPNDAAQSQALIQLYKNKCTHKQCLQCVVGNYVLKV